MGTMKGLSFNGCYDIFSEAYKYSSRFLLSTITIVICSILLIWVYEKPKCYQLIFKRSKQSNILSPVQSTDVFQSNCNQIDSEVTNIPEKRCLHDSKDIVAS